MSELITVSREFYPGTVRIKEFCYAKMLRSDFFGTPLLPGDTGAVINVSYSGGLGGFVASLTMTDGREVSGVPCTMIESIVGDVK